MTVMLRDASSRASERANPIESCFRRGVVDLPRGAEHGDDRGDEDDPARPGAEHSLRRPLDDPEGAREVGVDDRAEVVVGHPQQQHVTGDAGVGDEHVDRSVEVTLQLGPRPIDVVAGGDVALHAEHAVGRWAGVVRDGDVVAVGEEPLGAGETDAPRATSDEHPVRHPVSPPHWTTALAAVIPAPNPTKRIRSPWVTLP